MAENVINLYSDTQTRPTEPMRQVMAAAEVGDEQRFADPTVVELCERSADLLGKEAAVFLPSGTMCNAISMALHCKPGDEIICEESYHIIGFEAGSPAFLANAMIRPLIGERGLYTADQLRAAIRPASRYSPKSRLAVVEQTANMGGGTVWPLQQIRDVAAVARDAGLALHMDGARLMNAVVASGTKAADFTAPFDTCWLDLTKGLGCPVGAVLAGSRDLIEEAWVWKTRIGGSMRQAGIIAAAGLYALDHHVERLAEDHEKARSFADALYGVDGIEIEPSHVETNILFFEVTHPDMNAEGLVERLEAAGLSLSVAGDRRIRAVTHLDVSAEQVAQAAEIVKQTIKAA